MWGTVPPPLLGTSSLCIFRAPFSVFSHQSNCTSYSIDFEAIAMSGRAADTSRERRREIQILRSVGLSQSQIAEHIGLSINQVQYALANPNPRRRSGRPSQLTEEEIQQLIDFVTSSKEGRRLSYDQIPRALG